MEGRKEGSSTEEVVVVVVGVGRFREAGVYKFLWVMVVVGGCGFNVRVRWLEVVVLLLLLVRLMCERLAAWSEQQW